MIAGLTAPHQTGEHNAGKGSETDCLSAAGTRHHGEQKSSPWIDQKQGDSCLLGVFAAVLTRICEIFISLPKQQRVMSSLLLFLLKWPLYIQLAHRATSQFLKIKADDRLSARKDT